MSVAKKRGLGRGLEALLGPKAAAEAPALEAVEGDVLRHLPVDALTPGKYQPRKHWDQDKLAGVPWLPAPSGAPILAQALAWLDCRLHDRFRVGDHEIILGRPVGGKLVEPGAPPLLYPDTGDLDGSRGLYPDSLG